MSLRIILCSGALMPLLIAGGAMAHSGGATSAPPQIERAAPTSHLFDFPSSSDSVSSRDGRPVIVAQQVPAINSIEEQLRELNGKVEELNFQVLQMQDQIRRMKEDSEFRFQQLEGKQPGADSATPPETQKKSSVTPPETTAPAAGQAQAPTRTAAGSEEQLGAPPRTFGTITFDANGNVVSGSLGDAAASAPLGDAALGAAQDTTVAALPPTSGAEELYRNSYQFILSGDYKTAEAGFRKHIKEFPNDPRAADAHFWLGEALLGQDRYRDAAEVFLRSNRQYPDSKKAPDMLLKLGISLAAMNQRDVACATYAEIGQRYPETTKALQERVKQEEALAGC